MLRSTTGLLFFLKFVFCTEVLLPGKWLNTSCWWEVEKSTFLVSLCFHTWPLLYKTSQEIFSILLSPFPCAAEEGTDRVVWWAHGSQPRSTHPSTFWIPCGAQGIWDKECKESYSWRQRDEQVAKWASDELTWGPITCSPVPLWRDEGREFGRREKLSPRRTERWREGVFTFSFHFLTILARFDLK